MAYNVSADDASTRGGEAIYNSTFATAGRQFKLWSYMSSHTGETEPNLVPMTSDFNSNPMTDIVVTYDATKHTWKTPADKGVFYWPRPKYRLYTYAVYPSTALFDAGLASETTKSLDYTTTAISGDDDLMYAAFTDQRPSRDNSEKSRAVTLTFHHALTQIAFYGKLSPLFESFGWTVEVNSITVCNINSKGKFEFTPTELNASTLNITPADPSVPINYGLAMNTETNTESIEISDTEEATALTSPTAVTMLMPQTVTPWDKTIAATDANNTGGYLAISLRIIERHAGENEESDTYIYPLDSSGNFVTVYVPFDSTTDGTTPGPWGAGKLYKYLLTFGVGNSVGGNPIIQPISIEAAIAPWQEVTVSGEIKRKTPTE